jgi:hypothetical protein
MMLCDKLEMISAWIASKGIALAENTVMGFLHGPDINALIKGDLETINDKLDGLIQAAFKEAIMQLREGNLVACKDKLVQAISQDELNLPAKLLYIDFLRYEGKHVLALEYYWDLIESFQLQTGLLPIPLVNAYADLITDKKPLAHRKAFNIDCHSDRYGSSSGWYPNEFWCSLGGLVVLWERMFNPSIEGLFERLFSTLLREELYQITIHSWEGEERGRWNTRHREAIQAVTTRYVAISENNDRYVLYRLADGKKIPKMLTGTQYRHFFHGGGNHCQAECASWKSGEWKNGRRKIQFGGANVEFHAFAYGQKTKYRTVPKGYGLLEVTFSSGTQL